MKKQILLFVWLAAVLFAFTTPAFAENACPAGTQLMVQPNTGESFCIAVQPQVVQNTSERDTKPEKTIRESIRKKSESGGPGASGAIIEGGFGYSMLLAMDFHLSTGYHFSALDNGLSFGLYTDLDFAVGYPYLINWSFSPMIHVNGETFRGGLGFGVGLIKGWARNSDDDREYDDSEDYDSLMRSKPLFELKATVRGEWFATEHIFIGFDLGIPLIINKHIPANAMVMFYTVVRAGYQF